MFVFSPQCNQKHIEHRSSVLDAFLHSGASRVRVIASFIHEEGWEILSGISKVGDQKSPNINYDTIT
jgi:hypothetical protein